MGVTGQIESEASEPRLAGLPVGLLDAVDTLVLVTDGTGRVLWLNRAVALVLGRTRKAELVARMLWELPWRMISPRDCNRLPKAVVTASTGEPVRDVIEIIAADGRRTTIDFLLKPAPRASDDASAAMLIFEGRDVTDRQRAYEALQDSEVRLRNIVDTAPDGIVRIDDRGTVLSFNPAAEALFGYRADEIIGRSAKMLLPTSEGERFDQYVRRYMERGLKRSSAAPRETLGRHKNGTIFAVELSVSEVRLGNRRTFTGFVRDISRRKAAEAKLQQQQAEIAHVMRLNTVVAMASAIGHELNQPLTAIMSYAQACQRMLVASENVQGELRHAMGMIVAQTHRAGDIIRHVKDFTKKGKSLRTEQDINRIVLAAIEFQAQEARRSQVSIRSNLHANLPPVLADRIQIEQVILNLVRNSVQAIADANMSRREVNVSTTLNEENAVQVSVVDTGPGIPAAVANRLFEPFVTSKTNGMGVGLTICRSIINAHGGRLWADTGPGGEGAAFHFTLPPAEGSVVDDS